MGGPQAGCIHAGSRYAQPRLWPSLKLNSYMQRLQRRRDSVHRLSLSAVVCWGGKVLWSCCLAVHYLSVDTPLAPAYQSSIKASMVAASRGCSSVSMSLWSMLGL